MGRPLKKLLLPIGDMDPCNTWFLGPLPSPQLKRHVDRFSRFAGITTVTDRQTDRPRYSVCNNRPHLRAYYWMRPNNHKASAEVSATQLHRVKLTHQSASRQIPQNTKSRKTTGS